MRLEAQFKMGYYPAPLPAVDSALRLLAPPQGTFTILDPCAGEGRAIAHLSADLGCKPESTYLIELDAIRAAECQANLPGANILGPASFFGCAISTRQFGLIWLNPPFDQRLEGGRAETDFLKYAGNLLGAEGVLAFVCPDTVLTDWRVEAVLSQDYENFTVLAFPGEHRKYREVIVLATRRRKSAAAHSTDWKDHTAPTGFIYHIPATDGPKRFEKVELTEAELAAALDLSPLTREFLREPATKPLASPPLALGTGHIALLLASGYLDGLVKPRRGKPHVVRGTAKKIEYVAGVEDKENDKGKVTSTVTTISEKIVLTVRVALDDGTIITLGEEGEDKK